MARWTRRSSTAATVPSAARLTSGRRAHVEPWTTCSTGPAAVSSAGGCAPPPPCCASASAHCAAAPAVANASTTHSPGTRVSGTQSRNTRTAVSPGLYAPTRNGAATLSVSLLLRTTTSIAVAFSVAVCGQVSARVNLCLIGVWVGVANTEGRGQRGPSQSPWWSRCTAGAWHRRPSPASRGSAPVWQLQTLMCAQHAPVSVCLANGKFLLSQ